MSNNGICEHKWSKTKSEFIRPWDVLWSRKCEVCGKEEKCWGSISRSEIKLDAPFWDKVMELPKVN
jgi:hypothetical protein